MDLTGSTVSPICDGSSRLHSLVSYDCLTSAAASTRTDVNLPYLVPQNFCASSSRTNAFGVVRYLFQYSSSCLRIRPRSIGNGGSQSARLLASVIPAY